MRKQQGFTLIELIVVMAILAILIVLGIGSFSSSQQKGRDSRRKADLRSIATALELFFNDKRQYPNASPTGQISGCYPDDQTACPWGNIFQDKNNTVYMALLPIDPFSTSTYFYTVGGGNMSYQLYGRLENQQDPSVPQSGGVPQAYSGLFCGARLCNYGVSSTNTTPGTGQTLVNDP